MQCSSVKNSVVQSKQTSEVKKIVPNKNVKTTNWYPFAAIDSTIKYRTKGQSFEMTDLGGLEFIPSKTVDQLSSSKEKK